MFVESILPNQIKLSWYHSFQKTMFYLMKSKYAIFFYFKVTKIECSAFWGTPGIYKHVHVAVICILQHNQFITDLSEGITLEMPKLHGHRYGGYLLLVGAMQHYVIPPLTISLHGCTHAKSFQHKKASI